MDNKLDSQFWRRKNVFNSIVEKFQIDQWVRVKWWKVSPSYLQGVLLAAVFKYSKYFRFVNDEKSILFNEDLQSEHT